MTYIEQLLEKFDDIEAKAAFSGFVEKHSFLNDFIVDPALKAQTDEIKNWADTEWDYEHQMSKREYQQEQELAELRNRSQQKMKASELEDLDAVLGEYIKTKGLVSKAEYDQAIKEKSDAFESQLNTISTLATRVPYLNAKYQKEFGEMFDPDAFVKEATDKGFAKFGVDGLDRYYGEFTKDKAAAKAAADLEKLKADAKAEGAKEAREQMLATAGRGTPEVDGSPELSHFQQRIMKLNEPKADTDKSAAPPDAELGRGVIARFAALRGDAQERAGRVN